MDESAKYPLAEIFGRLPGDCSPTAERYRRNRLCPFNNKVPNCTKDKAQDPLGVCSILHNGLPTITCPIRFREDWRITDDAASFFFPKKAAWTSLTEVRLNDANGKSAGNIDIVLVVYDEDGRLLDFGALEIQAVYISGNVREPFACYMRESRHDEINLNWRNEPNYPRPDYLSSSRKRLAPQLLFKGGILHAWRKKSAVAIDRKFFETLPNLVPVAQEQAEITWLIYGLKKVDFEGCPRYRLELVDTVFTGFESALLSITTPAPGDLRKFTGMLQKKLDARLETPPDNYTLDASFIS
ncbi:MAG: hypothetical protein LBU39_08905 [Desulfobulbaceae bacterium]|jgi:hypothetical protein|nr:hypothetical protein [Desulfobulbaceae bacterium]